MEVECISFKQFDLKSLAVSQSVIRVDPHRLHQTAVCSPRKRTKSVSLEKAVHIKKKFNFQTEIHL